MKRTLIPTAILILASLTACGGNGSVSAGKATQAHGPIKIWYSNNPEEVAWGKQAVAAWNASHPKEQVSGQEIPAGKSSEEVISAAVTAGTEPCLIFNTSPASVPGLQTQGGLVPLSDFPDGASYIEARTGASSAQYQLAGRQVLPDAMEVEPGDDLLQQEALREGRHRRRQPAAEDRRTVPGHRQEARRPRRSPSTPSTRRRRASSSSPGTTSTRCSRRESGGKQLVANGKSTVRQPRPGRPSRNSGGRSTPTTWPAPSPTTATPSPTASPRWQSSARGRSASTRARSTGAWCRCRPHRAARLGDPHLQRRQEHRACSSRVRTGGPPGTSRSTSPAPTRMASSSTLPARCRCAPACRRPTRATSPRTPSYTLFAAQADRTVEVPNVPNSVAVWQAFRDSWSKSVIFGGGDPNQALHQVATKINGLVKHS